MDRTRRLPDAELTVMQAVWDCGAPATRAEYLAGQSRSFLDKLCGGSLSVFAAALCDSGLSREELDELRALLERNEL